MLGTRRVHRGRYERAPDLEPVTLPCGVTLIVEVKTRARGLALIMRALDQAAGYVPDATPCAIVSATGREPVACIPLRAFARIAGLVHETDNDRVGLVSVAGAPDDRGHDE
jgi:hypothetical protein